MVLQKKNVGGIKMRIDIQNIKKSFDKTEVLHGISFSIESGKALGLLGRNGAGKTTTIRILMNVFKASEGSILVDGKAFNPKDFKIGYMPEERGMYPKKKVLDQLYYFAKLRGVSKPQAKQQIERLMSKLQIEEYANRKLETLSKGNQQKVQLAETLVCDPEIIILDEPFSGLDPVNSQLLKDLIKEEIERGKLVIFSSHQMSYVEEFCEDIVILNKGEIVIQGTLSTIQKELGDRRGILSVNNMSGSTLKEYVQTNLQEYIKVEDVKKDMVVFTMEQEKSKILEKISTLSLDVSLFGDYKPSLTDIFVWKAGE